MLTRTCLILATLTGFVLAPLSAQTDRAPAPGNKPERVEWFRDLGFGLFIHWSVDSQLGTVISHSMVAADDDYVKRYMEELPKTFSPSKFNATDLAVLSKLAGVRYVVFTTKHHNGFAMFHTKTTDFGVEQTPFTRDITREIVEAYRAQGIAPGYYFSPEDFSWLHRNGITITRRVDEIQPSRNPGLMALNKAQMRELLGNYGPIDVVFFDAEPTGVKELAWQMQPNIVVTRGAMQTPEQFIPGAPLDEAWEACITMGKAWQYQPTNERYKTGGELIGLLVETRAKGGNLLLNVGPKPDGELPIEQEERLREIGLWMFVNSTAIYGVRPWIVTNEQDIWFTKKKDTATVYAIVKSKAPWKYGEWRDLVLRSVRATPRTRVRVLGQNDKVLEYQAAVVPKTTWEQKADGLHVRAMHAQRLYDDRRWPNPIVLELSEVEPALAPPRVATGEVRWDAAAGRASADGRLENLGDAPGIEVGVEYRDITGLDFMERPDTWRATPLQRRTAPGAFTILIEGLQTGRTYEVRSIAKHPLLTTYGREVRLVVP